jgi:GT2 family glycosyltransferase
VTPDVAAVLVNYNAGDELRTALQSIAEEMGGRAWEAVVVDNASTDGSESSASEFAPEVRLLRNAVNVGFGRGINQGVAASSAPVVLIMNPDCRLTPGAIAAMCGELQSHPTCAVVGPRVLDPDGSVQGSARGDPDMLTGVFGRTGLLRSFFPTSAAATRNVVTERVANGEPSVVVDWVSGACMLVRRSAFDLVRGFDERYFMYWEDADLCRRLRSRGFDVRYAPAATAVHRVGHSSQTARAASIKAFHASAYRYYTTHVATAVFDPRRPFARMLLALRCWWKLRNA